MEAVQTANPATPDEVWAILREVGRKQEENAIGLRSLKERQEETDRQMKETDRQMKELAESQKETGRVMRENSRMLGEYSRRFGEVVEHMIAPNLRERFRDLGLDFEQTNSGTRVHDHKNNLHFEIDFLLENGGKAMLVEVKTRLLTEHVKDHIERLEKMRKYADLRGDKRAFLGAVAGVVMSDNVKEYALKQGLYVIEPSGETFAITQPAGKPREW
jgi:hypothetical protein